MTAPELRLVLAQAADGISFAAFFILVPVSQFSERNPVIAAAYAAGGWAAVFGLKVGLALLATRRRRAVVTHAWYPPLRTVLLSAAAASGCVGAGFNLASLLLAKGWA